MQYGDAYRQRLAADSDFAKAPCLGAKAAFFGGPAMFGIAAAGETECTRPSTSHAMSFLIGQLGGINLNKACPEISSIY